MVRVQDLVDKQPMADLVAELVQMMALAVQVDTIVYFPAHQIRM
jgi:hypothetical protein